jgi:hypothetical protein
MELSDAGTHASVGINLEAMLLLAFSFGVAV